MKRFTLLLGIAGLSLFTLSNCGGGGDSTPTKPSISILYLDNTPLVGTNLPIQTSTSGVKNAQFFLDGNPLGVASAATEIIVNTSSIPDGVHTIRARGFASDNTFAEDAKTFLVDKAEIRRQALAYLNFTLPKSYDANGNPLPTFIYRWATTNITIDVVSSYYDIAKATAETFNKYCGLNLTVQLDPNPRSVFMLGTPEIGTNQSIEGMLVNQNGEIIGAYVAVRNTAHFSTQFLVAQAVANIIGFNLLPDLRSDLFTIDHPIPYLPFYIAEGLYIMYHEIPPGGLIPTQ